MSAVRDAADRGGDHDRARRDEIATALWWTYFDWVAIVVEYRLREATGTAQTTLARDAYSYIHFVMVAGIVLFAMSLKKALGALRAHLAAVPATALCAGLGAYLLAHVLLRYRISRTIGRGRPVAFAGPDRASGRSRTTCLRSLRCPSRPAVFVVLIAYEGIRYREPRAYIRHGAVPTRSSCRGRARQA